MENPVVLNYVRIAYVVSQLLILGTYYYVSLKVRLLVLLHVLIALLTAAESIDKAKERPDSTEIWWAIALS
jgi:hypothetical protein